MRIEVLKQLKYVKTCVQARDLCLFIRTNRAVLEPKDVQEACKYISNLCKEAGCEEASEICEKAAAEALTNEAKYLDLCMQSCVKCGQARKPNKKSRDSTYVT